jgi:RNA polymerase sigma-70 factor (sigma-E family)
MLTRRGIDDADGFRDFVVARSPALARTAYLLTGDRQLAEDLVQEALTRVASRWAKVAAGGDPEPYVRRVLYTCAVDGWRRKKPSEILRAEHVEQPDRGDAAEVTTQRVALRAAMAKLTVKQRAVLVLRFFEDRTEGQTAAALGCSVNTVKSQTRHALQRLQELSPELTGSFRDDEPTADSVT